MRTTALLFLLALALPAFAADYKPDPGHSQVGFTIRHLVSKVQGSFTKFDGSFSYDPAKPESLKADFAADATSIDTRNAKRDEHLRSADFFDAAKHPKLTFKTKSVKSAGEGKLQVAGDLSIHGVAKPVTFDVEYLGEAKDPWGNEKIAFEARARINRKDFGLTWNKTLDSGGLLIGEEVEILVQIEGDKKK